VIARYIALYQASQQAMGVYHCLTLTFVLRPWPTVTG